jgi:Fe-S-cluster containining protein
MTLHFDCTACGRCCNSLRLPLSIREAICWLDNGGTVQLMCDAAPDLPVNEADTIGRFRRERTFAAHSLALPIRVRVNLVAVFTGPCPNLLPNNLCGAYERRPATCRIYPAELRPDADIDPSARLCPPEAWSSDKALLAGDDGIVIDRTVSDAVTLARAEGIADVPAKLRMAELLQVNVAALANEGFLIWDIEQGLLRLALYEVSAAATPGATSNSSWTIATPTPSIRGMIEEAGGAAADAQDLQSARYLSLQPSIYDPAI